MYLFKLLKTLLNFFNFNFINGFHLFYGYCSHIINYGIQSFFWMIWKWSHCMKMFYKSNCIFSNTFVFLCASGSTEGISNKVIVHGPTVTSSNVHEANSATLQCSVLPTSRNKSCPAETRFYWFRAEDDKSLPNILYITGEEHSECNNQSCVCHIAKSISSHDQGTYHCALAACGEILFGNGTRLAANHDLGTFIFDKFVFLLVSS